mgnify:CR=1 FL=1
MGGSSKQTVGYWYNWAMCFGWCKGPVDAFLEFRAGDKTAWQGRLTSSGTISINKPNLWGGEDNTGGGTGGIVGSMDVMFGEATQAPNDYLVSTFGPQQSGRRGKFCTVFRGGKFGAFVANPKPVSAKLERILADWQDDTPWYPEKARIKLPTGVIANDWRHVELSCDGNIVRFFVSGILRGQTTLDYTPNGGIGGHATVGRYRYSTNDGSPYRGFIDNFRVTKRVRHSDNFSPLRDEPSPQTDPYWSDVLVMLPMNGADGSTTFTDLKGNAWTTAGAASMSTAKSVSGGASGHFSGGGFVSLPYASGLNLGPHWTMDMWVSPDSLPGEIANLWQLDNQHSGYMIAINSDGTLKVIFGRNTWPSDPIVMDETGDADLIGMNPAHILYDSLTHADLQGEPVGAISDASFRDAADKLYDEGFGLCTDYDSSQETPKQFQQRICNVIGASLSQSRVDGLYYLDLIRGDYDLDSLPIISDDDIISFSQDPSVITETGNKLSVEWQDPQAKETRTTAPIYSMGNIRSAGRVIPAETKKYPEIPVESLALRVAARDLKSTAVPLNKFDLSTRATQRGLRPGMNARLQMPSEGIADMVVVIGSVAHGTATKGDMKIVAVQNVYSMPSTVYVTPQDGLWVPPATTPTASPHQLAFEAPYVELASSLSYADLSALPADAGYLLTVATRPAAGVNYAIDTAAAGEDYTERGSGEWCPTATINEAVSYLDTAFTIAAGELLDRVEVGSWAWWDDEIVRVDAIDSTAGTLTLGRGCADTVPAQHDVDSRIYFCGDWIGSDRREYVGGDVVAAKLLTRTGSESMDLADATAQEVTFDERAARPYPPGQLRINGQADPSSIVGAITIAGVHRDRVQQADQLVDSEMAAIGPEAGTTYTVRYLLNGTLLFTDTGLAMPASSYTPSGAGIMRVEVESSRDGLTSYQMHVREFAIGQPLLAENGDPITTEDNQIIIMG